MGSDGDFNEKGGDHYTCLNDVLRDTRDDREKKLTM